MRKPRLTDMYQAAHHELVASALATKVGHEINPDFKIGCMVIAAPVYPLSPDPADVVAALQSDHHNLMFSDVHVRGQYRLFVLERGVSVGLVVGVSAG